MKAIRTIVENPKYREWVVMTDYDKPGEIATSGSPQIFSDDCNFEVLEAYYHTIGYEFNPTKVPIEMVDIEIVVKQDKDPYEHHELDMKMVKHFGGMKEDENFVDELLEKCKDIELSLRK